MVPVTRSCRTHNTAAGKGSRRTQQALPALGRAAEGCRGWGWGLLMGLRS